MASASRANASARRDSWGRRVTSSLVPRVAQVTVFAGMVPANARKAGPVRFVPSRCVSAITACAADTVSAQTSLCATVRTAGAATPALPSPALMIVLGTACAITEFATATRDSRGPRAPSRLALRDVGGMACASRASANASRVSLAKIVHLSHAWQTAPGTATVSRPPKARARLAPVKTASSGWAARTRHVPSTTTAPGRASARTPCASVLRHGAAMRVTCPHAPTCAHSMGHASRVVPAPAMILTRASRAASELAPARAIALATVLATRKVMRRHTHVSARRVGKALSAMRQSYAPG